MWATAVLSVSFLVLGVSSGNSRDERTISENDVSDSQEALAESDFRGDLVDNVLFGFHASGDHGDDCSYQNTQECYTSVGQFEINFGAKSYLSALAGYTHR
jgi:hypothetical protein